MKVLEEQLSNWLSLSPMAYTPAFLNTAATMACASA
jgi:hypothetical protein